MATLASVQSALGASTYATTNQWGGNMFDTAFSSLVFIICLMFSFWSYQDYGYTAYQSLGNITVKWQQMLAAYSKMHKTKRGAIKKEAEFVFEYFKSFWLGNWVGMTGFADAEAFANLKRATKLAIKERLATAWNITSNIQVVVSFIHKLAFTALTFFMFYGAFYGQPSSIIVSTSANGTLIALVTLVILTIFFHGLATLAVFNNWWAIHYAGVIIDFLCIFFKLKFFQFYPVGSKCIGYNHICACLNIRLMYAG